ncbi:hypothetical protein PG996_006861 [Apiospora saccharicola]|uniref:Uncharacterized protein n=1 Tax=Apiospora saccharicola TaxID=335842 RepID=A0ABR1V968_9PEZI
MKTYLQKAIAKQSSADGADPNNKDTVLGKGAGGRSGVTETGIVMKRDSGDEVLGRGQDGCDQQPGGYLEIGDLEVWVTCHGWSSLCVRDGRWRPGFHLEPLFALFTTVIDYATNRHLWRARDKPWVVAAERIWVDTPFDVHALVAEGAIKDMREMYRREVGRLEGRNDDVLAPLGGSRISGRRTASPTARPSTFCFSIGAGSMPPGTLSDSR